MEIVHGKEGAFAFFHDITAVTLSWSEAFDLTGVGPYFGHPQPPYRLGMALISPPHTLFRPSDHATRRTDPLAQSHRLLDVKGQPDTLWAKKNKLLSL